MTTAYSRAALVALVAVAAFATAAAAGSHSPMIGLALDGYPIYGPYTDGGVLPTDLDKCNGRTHPTYGYIYHVTPKSPYIIGCYHGVVKCTGMMDSSATGCASTMPDGGSSTNSHKCSDLTFRSGYAIKAVPWTFNSANTPTRVGCGKYLCPSTSAYSYDNSSATSTGLTNSISCMDTSSTTVTISANGLPDHDIGTFPMDRDSTGEGRNANPNTASAQSYSWAIPVNPKARTGTIESVLENSNALPMGPIAFLLNGVPLFSPVNAEGLDAVATGSDGYEVMGYCYGHPTNRGMYHHHSIPWCSFEDTSASQAVWDEAHAQPAAGISAATSAFAAAASALAVTILAAVVALLA